MTGGPDPFEHADAAYVLGALPHAERIAYEAHLRGCPRCAAAVAELAGLPGLLGRLPAVPDEPPDGPPDTVLPGVLAEVRRARLRRRAGGAVAGVAAAAALVAGTVTVTRPAGDEPGTPVPMTAVAGAPVHAQLQLDDVAWGTRVTMTCRYDGPPGGVSPGRYVPGAYSLVLVADGRTQTVARWQALPGRDAHVAGSTDLSTDVITEVQLRAADGTVLLSGRP